MKTAEGAKVTVAQQVLLGLLNPKRCSRDFAILFEADVLNARVAASVHLFATYPKVESVAVCVYRK